MFTKLITTVLPVLLGLVVLAGGAYFIGHHEGEKAALSNSGGSNSTSNSPSAATVRTAPIRFGSIARTISAYGVVQSQQSDISFISVPLESRIKRLLVSQGERVTANQKLFELELSPAQQIAITEAQINAKTASEQLAIVRQKKSEKLATNQELAQAEQTAQVAQAKYNQLVAQKQETLAAHIADFAGVVVKLDVQPDQTVPAGAAIVEIVSQMGIEVKLGVEAEDVRLLSVGKSVEISAVLDNSISNVSGTVHLISKSIDPMTRLADVSVRLPSDTPLLLGQYVRATTKVDVQQGLIAPRKAVLPTGNKWVVFTVENGKVVRHEVKVGIDNGTEVQIQSSDLKPGMSVVTVGVTQLTDGMPVTISPASTSTNPGGGS